MTNRKSDTVLVSSALEATWPKGKTLIFLGEWCLRFSRRHVWSPLDYSVMPYHWDDRSRIPSDLKHVEEVYEKLLQQLAHLLNDFHGVDYSLRYWRIVVGWWLFYFAQIFFDRWQVIQAASKAYPSAPMFRMPVESPLRSSPDTSSFFASSLEDWWNERLSADIAQTWTDIQVYSVDDRLGDEQDNNKKSLNLSHRNYHGRLLRKAITGLVGWVGRTRFFGSGVTLTADYLSLVAKLKLAFKLRQSPMTSRSFPRPPKVPPAPLLRRWHLEATDNDPFMAALAESVSAYLPSCFLEGYAENVRLAERWGSSVRPRVIMTANAFSSDELWKLWAALQVERGSKLIIGQHGGHYGVGAWSATFKHEIAISDRFLSWGWQDSDEDRIYPAPATKLIGQKTKRFSERGSCLQVTASYPRRSYHLYSAPIGPQCARYLVDQQKFASALSPEVRESLIVRLKGNDYGWDVTERWLETGLRLTVDPGIRPMTELLVETKLLVATYNATIFLESFRRGIPTVIFWDPNFWELSKDAQPFFDQLRQAQIFFEDPKECAEHVNEIWNDVASWWHSTKVQAAVSTFSNRYAYVGKTPISQLAEALTKW